MSNQSPMNNNLYKEKNRLKTFKGKWNVNYNVHPISLARDGFFYVGPDDRVKCVFCKGELWNWEINDVVETEHRRHYQNCPFLNGRCQHLNIPVTLKNSEKRINTVSDRSFRSKTFQRWHMNYAVNYEDLADAGFYYTGILNYIQCFSCGLKIPHWNQDDNIWQVHAINSRHCQYVHSVKGTDFVHEICERNNEVTFLQLSEFLKPKIDVDVRTPVVMAFMEVCDISVALIKEKLTEIRIKKGTGYTIVAEDFLDLM